MITSTVTPGHPLVVQQTRYDRHGDPFVIREYEAHDVIVLQRFYEAFEPKRAAQGLPPEDPARIRSWLSVILSTGVHLVACRGDDLIGHGLVIPTDRAGVGEYAVFLREDVRGRGIGAELNAAIVGAARTSGLRGLWLTVEPQNRAAIRSYEKVGFRFVGNTVFSLEVEMELAL